MIKTVVFDDFTACRSGVRSIAESDPRFRVVGEASGLSDAAKALEATAPDLAITELIFGKVVHLDIVDRIKSVSPDTKVLVYSRLDERIYAERMLSLGASGYVEKCRAERFFLAALNALASDEPYVSPLIRKRIVDRALGGRSDEADPIHTLTNRELEVFHLIAQGLTVKEIARRLFVSPKTVEVHRASIRKKLDAKSPYDLVRLAVIRCFLAELT